MNTMITQIVANANYQFTAILFDSETLKYRFVHLPWAFRDQAERDFAEHFPGVLVAHTETEFAQVLNQMTRVER